MPSGRPSGTLFSAQSLLWVSLPVSFICVTTGSQRGLRRASKIIPNRLKITLGPHWWTKACRGVPPGCLRDTQGAYLCMYLCVFMHIHAYLCIFMVVFNRIHAYSCILMHISYMFHAYVCIFMHIYAYLCIFMHMFDSGDIYIYSK